MFIPTKEQLFMLFDDLRDLDTIGDFTGYPRVLIQPCVEEYEVKPNRCYDNIFNIVATELDTRYVVGVITGCLLPICHCWLKVGDEYYDPTLDHRKYDDDERNYFAMAEFGRTTLGQLTKDNDYCPPTAAFVFEHAPNLLNTRKTL